MAIFDLTVNGEYAWKNIASETALIDIEKLGQVFEFDNRPNRSETITIFMIRSREGY